MIELRDYQIDIIERIRSAMRRGVRRVLVCSPTGSGKTILIAHMMAAATTRGKRSWLLCHRKELVDQSAQTFIEAADIHTGIIAAGFPSTPLAPVHVCSVPTLAKRLASHATPDLLVWDEAHHLASRSWSAIAQAFPAATHIGLTATPQRLDGQGLAPFFDELICGPSTADLIARGYLSPYKLYAPTRVSLTDVHRVAGDYNKHELADTMEASTVVGDAVSHYRQACPDARALVFAWSIAASERIAAQFVAAGVPAQHVDGETPKAARAEAMRRFRDGNVRVLCNVDLFGEGLDVPSVDAVFLLRPTQSLGLYLQQVGRGLRPSAGKTHVRIFDHAGNWERHGLPDDDRDWSLNGRQARPRDGVLAAKRCAQCFGVMRLAARQCPYCGAQIEKQAREIEQVDGVLKEADIEALRALRERRREFYASCRTLADWQALARKLGYKSGWGWWQWQRSLQHRRSA